MEDSTIKLIERIYNKLKIQSMFGNIDFKISREQIESIFEDNTFYVLDDENNNFEAGMKTVNLQSRQSKKASNVFYKFDNIIIAFLGLLTIDQTSRLKDCIILIIPIVYEIYKSLSIELSDDEIRIYMAICYANDKGKRVTKDNIGDVIYNEVGIKMSQFDILHSIRSLEDKQIIEYDSGFYNIIEDYKMD
ncbi:hypothetical protein [Thomasclavelia sp.]|uniref:hypothetical protein n=1 Tax=Thomasclavelia sp. TaxID=3025757 RepID=UPI0025D394B6|nr:hypothetical protein [Thomasclavelia sp.]